MSFANRPLTVSEVVNVFKVTLEQGFPEICFEGEISEVKQGKTGHVYFTIKDQSCQLAGVAWAGLARTFGFKIEPGMSVQCLGKPTIYPQRGSLQVVVHRMIQGGEGLLKRKFLELKAKLEKEGYFNTARKRKLPFLPKAIGIVTSAQGAVIHDMMVKLKERMPQIPVYLIDVKVQGEGAAEDIASAVQHFSASDLVDVVIVARGGGSLEDLWAFNEEVVVKAIFACSVPVISGVGHEVDVSLADFAADVRAPTPTAAAEMVVPKRSELLRQIAEYERRLNDTDRWLQPLGQRLDELAMRVERKIESRLEEARLRILHAQEILKNLRPDAILLRLSERISYLQTRSNSAIERLITNASHSVDKLGARLEAVSPIKVLKRGYSIAELNDKVVTSATQLTVGDELKVIFASGQVLSQVKQIED